MLQVCVSQVCESLCASFETIWGTTVHFEFNMSLCNCAIGFIVMYACIAQLQFAYINVEYLPHVYAHIVCYHLSALAGNINIQLIEL